MANGAAILGLRGLSAAAVLAVAACSPPTPTYEQAHPAEYDEPEPPPLAGAPLDEPPTVDDHVAPEDLAGAPPHPEPPSGRRDGIVTFRRADGVEVTAMRPIPNPGEGLAGGPPDEAPAAHAHGATEPAPAPQTSSAAPPPTKAQPPVEAPVASAPAPSERPAPPTRVTPLPARTAQGPVAAVRPPPRPAAPLAQPPATPFVQAMALQPPTDSKLATLQAALAADVAAGARLSIPEAAWSGQPAKVTLALPPGLLAMLQHEAGRVGLADAARTVQVAARLSGAGYRITPEAAQSVKLVPGQAAAFEWQVAAAPPAPGVQRAALRADVEASLSGTPAARTFSLTALEQPAPPPPPAERRPSAASAVARPVLIAILAVLGLAAILGAWRNLAARRAEEALRRRRANRPASDYTMGVAPPPPEPAPARAETRPERETTP